jgi:hypothetical protein
MAELTHRVARILAQGDEQRDERQPIRADVGRRRLVRDEIVAERGEHVDPGVCRHGSPEARTVMRPLARSTSRERIAHSSPIRKPENVSVASVALRPAPRGPRAPHGQARSRHSAGRRCEAAMAVDLGDDDLAEAGAREEGQRMQPQRPLVAALASAGRHPSPA